MARARLTRTSSSGKGMSRSVGRERKITGPTANYGLIGTGTVLSPLGSGAVNPSDVFSPPASAKSKSANTKGTLGAKSL